MACTFDIARVPFSTFESWMSFAIPNREEDLFFRDHHNGANNLCPLSVVVDGQAVKPETTARPWVLLLSHGDGQIEICFESPKTVRMRGRGIGLQFGGRNLAYSEGPGLVTLNKPHSRRYGIEMLHGSVELHQQVETQPVFPITVEVCPADDGCWELAMDEFWSTWVRPDRRASFGDCLASAEAAFTGFLDTMPAARPQDEETRALATYVDWSCTVGPCGLLKRPAMFMSKNWMCNVWSWDQCFNAMALAKGQPDLALDQMLILVDNQDEFGSYPDSVNDLKIHYNFSKPPVHGMAFKEILGRMPEPPSRDVMTTMVTSLSRQADWWMTHRRLAHNRLPHYLHGNDSGWDNSTMFAGGVPLVAPDLAALLVLQMDVLAELTAELGDGDKAAEWSTRADSLQEALLDELWRGDHFVAKLANDGAIVEHQSLIPWLPLILGERLPEGIRVALKTGIEGHLTEWGLATEQVDSPRYRENGYWRGPIWAPSTWIAVEGLDRAGFHELADTVSERFCRLCGKSGFAENFNALTGDALCDPAYTWTASVFLLLAERMFQRQTL